MPRGVLLDYAEELGRARCQELVEQLKRQVFADGSPSWTVDPDPELGCWLWLGRTLPEGYMQFKRKTRRLDCWEVCRRIFSRTWDLLACCFFKPFFVNSAGSRN
jgi:hypothetical protein